MDLHKQSILAAICSRGYNVKVETMRQNEYPQLSHCVYLDHASTTLYPKSAIEEYAKDLTTNLYGNPHSPAPSSQLSTSRVEDVRLRVLRFFKADPEYFDVVFCANATAAIKLVTEGMASLKGGFDYYYHFEAHTSLVGVRESSRCSNCLESDEDVESWLKDDNTGTGLFAWPGQSNFSGRRLPRDWARRMRERRPNYYSLLDAAAVATTGQLDLSDPQTAPDFTALSFYKIFGFPDLGALIVRKSSCTIFSNRRYFGGGTVDFLLATETDVVARKTYAPHAHLEDGTIAFHSIIALDHMINAHERLYGSQDNVSRHAFSLAQLAFQEMDRLTHGNGKKLCTIYGRHHAFTSSAMQGPIISFNMQRANGVWMGYSEVEKLMAVKGFHVRVGGICNSGSIQLQVGLSASEMKKNFAAGHKCSDENDIMNGKPTGAIRISFGAMSTLDDVLAFIRLLKEFYVELEAPKPVSNGLRIGAREQRIESLTVYPIKSCSGFKIPQGVDWEVRSHGLAWDREWCLVHLGTGRALSQKAYTKMVFIRPKLDLQNDTLLISCHKSPHLGTLRIPLDSAPSSLATLKCSASRVCGDQITAFTYDAPEVEEFFTGAVGVPCTLARLPPSSTTRNFKPHLQEQAQREGPQILLSNESPILIVNRASVDRLNEEIGCTGGKKASPDVFRANVVIGSAANGMDTAYAEDRWSHVKIGQEVFELLGPCRRCHMICIDQDTAEKNEEPFVTLSKTRRIDGRLLFGQHATHLSIGTRATPATIRVGDIVRTWNTEDPTTTDISNQQALEHIRHGSAGSSYDSTSTATPSPPNTPVKQSPNKKVSNDKSAPISAVHSSSPPSSSVLRALRLKLRKSMHSG